MTLPPSITSRRSPTPSTRCSSTNSPPPSTEGGREGGTRAGLGGGFTEARGSGVRAGGAGAEEGRPRGLGSLLETLLKNGERAPRGRRQRERSHLLPCPSLPFFNAGRQGELAEKEARQPSLIFVVIIRAV